MMALWNFDRIVDNFDLVRRDTFHDQIALKIGTSVRSGQCLIRKKEFSRFVNRKWNRRPNCLRGISLLTQLLAVEIA